MLRQSAPRNARSQREANRREPQLIENPKITLLLRGERCSAQVQRALVDIHQLKQPLTKRFTKRNAVRPFEDATSLEFFARKNDASLLLVGHHSKKRPHGITVVRTFDHAVLDMMEVMLDPTTFKSMAEFSTRRKPAVGLRPLLAFSGTAFESPTPNAYTLAKSLFVDLFRGREVGSVDVEALQWMMHFSIEETEGADAAGGGDGSEGVVGPPIRMRCYRLVTMRSGQKLPRVEVEEIGPRMDLRVGRVRHADEAMMRAALQRPKQLQERVKKNIQTDSMGDKIGRIHVGRQDLSNLQTRKMKGLKRHLDVDDADGSGGEDDGAIETDIRSLKVAKIG